MKQKYCLLVLAGMLMASCSNDDDSFVPEIKPASGQLTFTFPGTAKGVVPYANVEATANENELETLDIYVFGEDTLSTATPKPMLLEEIFRSGIGASADQGEKGFTLNTTGDSKTATISVGSGLKKSFYFVANGRGHSSLNDVQLHVTDTAVFKKKMSNQLTKGIACPLLMSAVSNINDVSQAGTSVAVELVRRMARFDIKNNSQNTNFTILKVALENIPADVAFFDTTTYVATNRLALVPVIDFPSIPNSNTENVANSVFYMYPADSSYIDNIHIKLSGVVASGSAQVLSVPLKNYQTPDKRMNIAPNNRYLISVVETGNGDITANLTVTEWLTGDTINSNTGYGTIAISSEANGFSVNTLSVEANAMADAATIQVAAETDWQPVVDPSCANWITVEQAPVVAPDTKSRTFTVKTTMDNPSSTSTREGVVMVQSVAHPSLRQPLVVKQAAQNKADGKYIDLTADNMEGDLLLLSGIAAKPATVTVDVAADAEWTATKTAAWLDLGTATQLRSASTTLTGPGTFAITAQPNTTDKERIDTVKISISGNATLEKRLIVRQPASTLGKMTISGSGMAENKVSLSGNGFTGDEYIVRVNSTLDWEVEIEENNWLTLSKPITLNQGTFNGAFSLTATRNTDLESGRSVKVTVKYKDPAYSTLVQEITFTQEKGVPVPVTIAPISNLDITGAISETVAVACSEGEWTVTNDSEAGWLTTTNDASGNITITAEAISDPDIPTRTATVTVTSVKDSSVSTTFTITQQKEADPVGPEPTPEPEA